jgi:hypothetical protein
LLAFLAFPDGFLNQKSKGNILQQSGKMLTCGAFAAQLTIFFIKNQIIKLSVMPVCHPIDLQEVS